MSTWWRLPRIATALVALAGLLACASGTTAVGDGGTGAKGGSAGGGGKGGGGVGQDGPVGGGGGAGGGEGTDAPKDVPVDTPLDSTPDAPPAGMKCAAPGDCPSGFCVDGYCCDMACTEACRSCSLAGKEGVCGVVKSAEDADTCMGTMTCSAAGACVKKTGQTCAAAAECSTGSCKDGVCCDLACTTPCMTCKTGACTAVTAGDDAPECTGGSMCDAMGKCKKTLGQACTLAADCVSGFCADTVCCAEACTASCRNCNLAGMAGTCGNVPAGMKDTGCTSTSVACDGMGSCKKQKGQTCATPTECASGFCVDGYCCEAACDTPCKQCNKSLMLGTCADIATGLEDTNPAGACDGPSSCDGMGTCKLDNGQACAGGATACTSGFCADGVCCNNACTGVCRNCNGTTPGTCKNYASGMDPEAECGNYNCTASGTCYTYCYSNAPYCSVSAYCDTLFETCGPKKATGAACTAAGQCVSGFCADGVCCNEACAGTCRACNLAASPGVCSFIPAGMDPGLECATSCNTLSCTAANGTCDGAGACQAAATCGAYSCLLASGCRSTCTQNSHCCGTRTCAESVTIALTCGGSDLGQTTAVANDNFTFTSQCVMQGDSDRLATSTWGGYEYVYKFTAATSQTVIFSMHRVTGSDLDLFVFEAEPCSSSGNCCTTVTSCMASAHATSTTDESVSYDVVAGQTYYVVVDAVSALSTSTFDLTSVICM